MIDLKYALEAFDEYLKSYPNTHRVDLKVAHTKRVLNNNIGLAKSLRLSQEDINLAGLIGLLHDIGRFEQVKRYDTFIDSESINHAMFSSEQLFKEGLIRRFIKDDKYDEIIKAAIENHNKFEIETGLSDKALLHAKMIRDSDKIDIYVQVLESDPKLVFDGSYDSGDTISEKVFRDFIEHRCIKTRDMNCKVDDLVRKVALIYGLYYPQSLQIVKQQGLINKLVGYFKKSFEFSNQQTIQMIDMVNKIANSYMEHKIDALRSPAEEIQI